MTTTATAPTAKATANKYGVRWAASKSGRFDIAVKDNDVWMLRAGTHDLVLSRTYPTAAEATARGNELFRNR